MGIGELEKEKIGMKGIKKRIKVGGKRELRR